MSLASYLSQLPGGTFVAAAAGSDIAQTLRPQLLTAFRAIGGGRAPDNVGPFYGIIGIVGSAAVVEEASGGTVQIHVAAGDVVDSRGTLFRQRWISRVHSGEHESMSTGYRCSRM